MAPRPTQDDATQDAHWKLSSLVINASTVELVSWLTHEEPRARELAAAYLGDRLVQACKADAETAAIVLPLVEALQRETDPTVQEEIAHSLGCLVEYGIVSRNIVPALKECLPRLHVGAAEHVNGIIEDAG